MQVCYNIHFICNGILSSAFQNWRQMVHGERDAEDKVTTTEQTHIHCNSCINIKLCLKDLRWTHQNLVKSESEGSSSNSPNYCPVIPCPHKCHSKFHSCKLQEHELLCSKKLVPCLNVNYGCPFVMERRLCGSHLDTCPAR